MTDQEQLNAERLEKIRALLAKAEATHFPEEAKAFTAKAEELMLKWSIDDAMLNMARKGTTDDGTLDLSDIWISANEYRGPKIDLLTRLVRHHDCKIVLHPQQYRVIDGKSKRMVRIAVIGFERDRQFVEMVFTSLLLQSELEFLLPETQIAMESEIDNSGQAISWRNSFMRGYASAVAERLADVKARMEVATPFHGNAMALMKVDKAAVVQRKLEVFYPKLRTGHASTAGHSSANARQHGYKAGLKADIGSPKVRGGVKGQLT